MRQLTFAGRRSGEGYFSSDGRSMVFQSEREPGNPFYQIYHLDLATGETRRVSPGTGKTTCAWIHPSGDRVLFASTHADPEAVAKQQREIEFRESGEERRYAWDYDEHYDLYAAALDDAAGGEHGDPVRLTHERGYDAEGSYSPDGTKIAFASNRHAYVESLSDAERALFERDPSSMMEIYIMNADGSDPRRLTRTLGYDGGPFFSPDGKRIVWRRFSEEGTTAEIFSMKLDGSDVRQLTEMGAMSWAPFYHPSGDYLIFATNRHGFDNFELYVVASEQGRASRGQAAGLPSVARDEPVRVTDLPGFDALPVFLPNGRQLAWTRRKESGASSQIFVAEWDDAAVRSALGLPPRDLATAADESAILVRAKPAPDSSARERIQRHVTALTAERTQGRLTGTEGARIAREYVADRFASLGLEPAGQDSSFFDPFEFTAGISLGPGNGLSVSGGAEADQAPEVDVEWRPLAFSRTGEAPATGVVFAGYGIVAPGSDGQDAYDSYAGLDVEGRWVLVFRDLPDDLSAPRRQHLARYASLRHKAMVARDQGALGLVLVAGPLSKLRARIVPLGFDVALAGTSVFALSVSDAVGERLLAGSGKTLESLQRELAAGGEPGTGFEIPGIELAAQVDLVQETRTGQNVVARLRLGGQGREPIVIGAHLDHLGLGGGGNSLARPDERERIHPGADDNASGVAALLDVAARLAADRERLHGRDVLFAAWSGEEIGLLGSSHFTRDLEAPNPHAEAGDRPYAAYFNMDMVGRLRGELYVQGVGSSSIWPAELEHQNVRLGLPIVAQQDSYLPTDATSFYVKGVPILSLFTGVHEDYHTPRDTPDKLNLDGIEWSSRLVASLARSLVVREANPDYVALDRSQRGPMRANIRAFLGTIPSYGQSDVVGVLLSGVATGGPAERAGLRADDIIVELAGRKIENIYDYTYAIEALEIGEPVSIVVRRGSERVSLQVTPESRN